MVLAWAALKMGKLRDIASPKRHGPVRARFFGRQSSEYRDKFGHYEVWLKPTVKRGGRKFRPLVCSATSKPTEASQVLEHTDPGNEKIDVVKFEPDPSIHDARGMAQPKNRRKANISHRDPDSNITPLSAFVPCAQHLLCDLLHADRAARAARGGRRDGDRAYLGAG